MTKIARIGNLKIGGKNPVRIKGMLKNASSHTDKLIKEAKILQREGAEAIRIAVKEKKDAGLAPLLRRYISLPLVADVHFHHQLVLYSIEEGFEGVRINPSNIYKKEELRQIAREAKKAKISLRVGVNSGGFKRIFSSPKMLAQAMVRRANDCIRVLEKEQFFDIIVSLKGSDVSSTIIANELFAKKNNYPLHLGITASGPLLEGVIKSSLGIGALLREGVGNVVRVSLTAPSFWEIRAAKYILQALNLRQFGAEIISCPTCSRCEVDLIKVVDKFKKELDKLNLDKFLRIAIMGCVVNGPGEAYQADIGAAFGRKKAAIFKKDKILGWSSENNIVKDLIEKINKITV